MITGYLQEIAKNARTISEATEETAAGSEQTSAAVQEITAQAHYLLKVAEDLNVMLGNARRSPLRIPTVFPAKTKATGAPFPGASSPVCGSEPEASLILSIFYPPVSSCLWEAC